MSSEEQQTEQIELVLTGDIIPCHFQNPIIGHGVLEQVHNGEPRLVAAVTGYVERINKVITIRPQLNRYLPEVGDVVVGRITGISEKKWRLDINARASATLQISAINLPGGQRKRTEEDALQMRFILRETELISAEVQRILPDRSAALHTRSLRYGKLGYGVLVQVAAGLVKRQKQHFFTLSDLGVEIVMGVNGYIWLQPATTEEDRQEKARMMDDSKLYIKADGSTTGNYEQQKEMLQYRLYDQNKITQDVFESIARLRNAIRLLDITYNYITIHAILDIYNQSVDRGLLPAEMITTNNIQALTQYLRQKSLDDNTN